MDRKLGADFGRALPSGRAFLLGETWDLKGMADPPHGQAGEALPGSGTQPAGIERGGNLTIGLGAGKVVSVRPQSPRSAEDRGANRKWKFQRRGRAALQRMWM